MIIVQVGCNNGKDHILDFCLKNKSLIDEIHLIEPNLVALEDCKQTYSDFHQARFYGIAIVPNNDETINLYIPQDKAFSGHASTLKNHLSVHNHNNFDTINVSALNLNKFFDSNRITRCDRLYVDAEGLDCEIILNFDFAKHNVGRIEFETLHSDGSFMKGKNYNSCIDKLKTIGYKSTEAGEYNEAYEL